MTDEPKNHREIDEQALQSQAAEARPKRGPVLVVNNGTGASGLGLARHIRKYDQ